jgi:beta-glucosidase
VAFAFGHGLSYTTFHIGIPTLSSPHIGDGEMLRIDVPVTNTGDRRGSEVVQVYVGADDSPVLRAPKQLAAFAKVTLDPGESIVSSLTLDRRAFARWVAVDDGLDAVVSRLAGRAGWVRAPRRPAHTGWVVDEGRYTVHIGRSSRSISHAADVTVSGGPA